MTQSNTGVAETFSKRPRKEIYSYDRNFDKIEGIDCLEP